MNLRTILQIPNLLTLFRFPAGPIMAYLILQWDQPGPSPDTMWVFWVIVVLSLLVYLSDLFDGMLARKYNCVSDFGKVMDPVADATFFLTVLFAFTVCPRLDLPLWIPLLVLYREIAMHVMRRYVALQGIVMAASMCGKIKMMVQCICLGGIGVLIGLIDSETIVMSNPQLQRVAFWAGIIVVLANWISFYLYLKGFPAIVAKDNTSPSSSPAPARDPESTSP